ncbi:MAG: hypothetical protein M3220_13610 [Chloroflexota bacterium]|nr:hypothetical protein [Chloroflexota bacterium]
MPMQRLPPPAAEPRQLAQRALALAQQNPSQALTLLQDAARQALRQGESRTAALILHRRAGLLLANDHSPIPDLAMAARLLENRPEERALVLLDLGQALAQNGDLGRATLTLGESERLARQGEQHELTAAARHALSQIAEQQGDYTTARTFLQGAGRALVYDVEHDLLATLRDMGNLPHDPRAEWERARREQAVEEELARLKREMGVE